MDNVFDINQLIIIIKNRIIISILIKFVAEYNSRYRVAV